MKKQLISGLALILLLASCQNTNGDKATTTTAQEVTEQKGQTYTVEADKSSLKWTGYHKGGLNPRYGILKSEGTLSAENNAVTGGSFTIDVNSILTDTASVDPATSGGKKSSDLDAHLKSADFFDTAKYPTAKFEITKVGPFDATQGKSVVADATNTVSGNLTIKDKTVNVTFPAKITFNGDEVTFYSKFTIQRQDWGLTYGTEGNPQDWMIAQNVDIELNVTAKNAK
ncbi:MAG: YceI family protein [Sphingobacterium sp.]|jgi:polyisoprenoid-binding protein YceI|uniref:YceI family protein n=1 Tax=Sphingobacterium sp. TaxID=341027 RepID=UPI002838D838|nr:YceI family protein [Sphingobacterium sp.]MDR0263901.1 YceI family protein [Sphingobacterium sp.]